MQSFLTGSRIYGDTKNTKNSDLDLVLYLEEDEKDLMINFAEYYGYKGGSGNSWDNSLRFDMLNVIVVSSKAEWDIWQEGTKRLKAIAPVTKEQAIEMFTKLGLPQRANGTKPMVGKIKISSVKKCTCDSMDLFRKGCTCGGI